MPNPLSLSDTNSCDRSTYAETMHLAATETFKPTVTINRKVENYRVLFGLALEQIKQLGQVENYSRNTPIHGRSHSKLVVDQKTHRQLQEYHPTGSPESESLLNQFLQAHTEITPIGPLVEDIKENHSAAIKIIELFEKIPFKKKSTKEEKEIASKKLLSFFIGQFLPDYAFRNNSQLETVTVTPANLVSSLSSPDNIDSKDATKHLLTGSFSKNKKTLMTFIDGSAASHLISMPRPRITSLDSKHAKENHINNAELKLYIDSGQYSRFNSKESAKNQAKVVEQITNNFATEEIFFSPHKITIINDTYTEANLHSIHDFKALPEFINNTGKKNSLKLLCFLEYFDGNLSRSESLKNSCANTHERLINKILDEFILHINIYYLTPELKKLAKKHNIDFKETNRYKVSQSKNYSTLLSQPSDSLHQFRLADPDIHFVSQNKESLLDFIHAFVWNASDTKAIYAFPGAILPELIDPTTRLKSDQCIPLLNESNIPGIIQNGWPELEAVTTQVINSFPSGAKHCNLDFGEPVANDDISASPFPSPGSALSHSMMVGGLSGVLDGVASYFDRQHWVRNPLVMGGLGYGTGGYPGLALGITGWALSKIPDYLRQDSRAGSLQRGCAMIVDNLSVALPFLQANFDICQYIGGITGYIIGKYSSEAALATLATPEPREDRASLPNKYRKTRAKCTAETAPEKADTAPEKTVPTVEIFDHLVTEYWASSDEQTKKEIADNLVKTIRENLSNPNDSNPALPESLINDLLMILTWSTPELSILITYQMDKIADSSARADFLKKHLNDCECYVSIHSENRISPAFTKFPDLYRQFLKLKPDNIDTASVKRLQAILSEDHFQELHINAIKILINHFRKNDKNKAMQVLNDCELPNETKLDIFENLPTPNEFIPPKLLEQLGTAYLERIESKPKDHKPEHIRKNIQTFKKEKTLQTDDYIHYLIECKKTENNVGLDDKTIKKFQVSLKNQAESEIKNHNSNIKKTLRAQAILIKLENLR